MKDVSIEKLQGLISDQLFDKINGSERLSIEEEVESARAVLMVTIADLFDIPPGKVKDRFPLFETEFLKRYRHLRNRTPFERICRRIGQTFIRWSN